MYYINNHHYSLTLHSSTITHRAVEAGNQAFWQQITQWGFGERGVLRTTGLRHALRDSQHDGQQGGLYRVNDYVVVEMDIEERRGDKWVPYKYVWVHGNTHICVWCTWLCNVWLCTV